MVVKSGNYYATNFCHYSSLGFGPTECKAQRKVRTILISMAGGGFPANSKFLDSPT